MKKQIYKTLTLIGILSFGIVISVALSYVHATGVWNEPTGSAPNANTLQPINVGTVAQIKGINTLGGLGVNEFAAFLNAQFDGIASFRGQVLGVPDADPTVNTSALAVGDTTSTVHVGVNGDEYTYAGGLYSDKIKAGTMNGLEPLCADANGNIIFCPPAQTPPPPPPPAQSKEIYVTVYNYCEPTSSGRGNNRINFTFTSPTPVPLDFQMAACTIRWWYPSRFECWGGNLLDAVGQHFDSYNGSGGGPTVDVDARVPNGFAISIPQGSTSYTVPVFNQNGSEFTCMRSGNKVSPIAQARYTSLDKFVLVFKQLTGTDYTLHMHALSEYDLRSKYNTFIPYLIN